MELHRLTLTSRKDDTHTVSLFPLFFLVAISRTGGYLRQFHRQDVTFCRLVEQVHTHRSGEFLFQLGVDVVFHRCQMELLTEESLILRRHILKADLKDAVLLGHHLRAQRMQDFRTEVGLDADARLQGHDLVPVAHGLLFATTYEGIDGFQREACSIVALSIYGHVQVGHLDVIIDLVLTVHVDDLTQNAHGTTHVVGFLRRSLHGDANHDLSAHLTSDIHRIVILQATVNQHLVADSHRREGSGNSHRSTHGLWQSSTMEIHLFIGNDIRCHTGKGNRQLIEVERIGESHTELLEEFCQVLALDDTARILILLAKRQARAEEISILLLAVAKTLITQVFLIGNHIAPVLHANHRIERMRIVTDGIESADNTTHRGASDIVDGDARLFQHFQHTDMGHAFGTTTTQYYGHLFPRRFFTLFLLLSAHHATNQHGCQYHDYLFHRCKGSKNFTNHNASTTDKTSQTSVFMSVYSIRHRLCCFFIKT